MYFKVILVDLEAGSLSKLGRSSSDIASEAWPPGSNAGSKRGRVEIRVSIEAGLGWKPDRGSSEVEVVVGSVSKLGQG